MAASQPFGFSTKGGLNTNLSQIEMLREPGIATTLVNFEVDPDGGYRRVNGFEPYGGDSATRPNTFQPVLGIKTYADGVIVCSGDDIFFSNDGVTWLQINRSGVQNGGDTYAEFTGRSILNRANQKQSSISIYEGNKSEYGEVLICDGHNKPFYFYMTGTGALNTRDFFAEEVTVHSTEAPSVGTIHSSYSVVSGTAENPNTIYISHEHDITTYAIGIELADKVVGLRSFRNDCIIFCRNSIYKLINIEDSNNTAIVPITKNVGCLDGQSIQEIGGDLVFLSPDGIRTLAGTARIGDVELTSVSRNIQKIITDITTNINTYTITSVVLRAKSQYRLYYNDPNKAASESKGIIGTFTGQGFEWSETKGIEAIAIDSGFLYNDVEQIIHGDTDGYIYNHDVGKSFIYAGTESNVPATYETPYLDFGDLGTRKTLHYVKVSITPAAELGGFAQPKLSVKFDFDDETIQQPSDYLLREVRAGAIFQDSTAVNVTSIFGESVFGAVANPLVRQNIQGSCYSSNYTITSNDKLIPYTINGIYVNYVPTGRR